MAYDTEALAQAVAAIKKKTQEDIEKVRKYAENRFSPTTIYKKQIDIYKNLLTPKILST